MVKQKLHKKEKDSAADKMKKLKNMGRICWFREKYRETDKSKKIIKRKTNKMEGREKKRAKITKKQCRSMVIYKQEKRKERMNSE